MLAKALYISIMVERRGLKFWWVYPLHKGCIWAVWVHLSTKTVYKQYIKTVAKSALKL